MFSVDCVSNSARIHLLIDLANSWCTLDATKQFIAKATTCSLSRPINEKELHKWLSSDSISVDKLLVFDKFYLELHSAGYSNSLFVV